ncbi:MULTISPECIES: SGNH/GDSL hydrolase family protein [Actinoalloteichus]|uniref:GDSL-like Lipase/Acylhydrolase family n=1 Tax=Actinoalloteichus fjordicus TaxID=1612552 RepID=A0AAC9PT10_9PSEU|nr:MULTISPECIES: SGNH/GDSL hydrolase family protein [Actinoalloteichus]APU16159.1 GDSL-like Lipase/Acylhydrolase family [Actinoalloteichus fjordicus]APU22222.1 GDSL-like Lipase/Acylhydrolase family [Actinoalloteichus sp. GBA129-24]
MTKTPSLVLGLSGLLLLAAGCSGESTANDATAATDATAADAATEPGLSKVLFIGDSIAVGEALPLAAAFEASGVEFESLASEGGGNVVGPFAEEHWTELPEQIATAEADAVVYQITTYDWGTQAEQEAGYDRLSTTVTEAGAELVFVTVPPIRPDDFYEPHMADLDRTADAARAVAAESSGQARVLDAGEVWGTAYTEIRDGTADRNADGIHTCPQGAARFTAWLLAELADQFPGFTPAAAEDWANAGWSADGHFGAC